MQQEPDWAVVLEALHEGQMSTEFSETGFSEPFTLYELVGYLTDETSLNKQEVKQALSYLDSVGLVVGIPDFTEEVNEEGEIHGGLTKSGFEVADKRASQQRQERHDRVIVGFTVILALATTIQALKAIYGMEYLSTQLTNTAVLLGGLWLMYQISGEDIAELIK